MSLCDNRAISSINLLKNRIPVGQAQEHVKIMQAKEKLITLCGLSKEETELDFGGQNLRAGDAVLIANDIGDMRALSVLSLANNKLTEGALRPNKWAGEYNAENWGKENWHWETDMTGIIAIANAIPNMGAMTSLNLASNALCGVNEYGIGTFDATGIWLHHHCCFFLNNTCFVSSLPG
jgi:hypothetical protein